MKIEVVFEKRKDPISWSDQEFSFAVNDLGNILIELRGPQCRLLIDGGDEQGDLEELIYAIWELLAWYDGYFYKPLSYQVNGTLCDINKLIKLSYYVTDNKWRKRAFLLGRNHREISENTIQSYLEKRQNSRKNGSMSSELISSYFYLLSEAYKNINIEHRLVLLMHICDGVMLNFFDGNKKNNAGNIIAILNKLNIKEKYQAGMKTFGLSEKKAKETLGYTRTELTHYQLKKDSLYAHFYQNNDVEAGVIYWYVFYLLSTAVRIAMLEGIGINVEDEIKEYILEKYSDWIRLEKNLGICVNPENRMRQIFRNFHRR